MTGVVSNTFAGTGDANEIMTRADGSELVGKVQSVHGAWAYTFASWDSGQGHGIVPTVTIVKAPEHGSVATNTGSVGNTEIVGTVLTYTPQAGFDGTDSITYQVSEQFQKSNYNTITNTYTVNLAVQ